MRAGRPQIAQCRGRRQQVGRAVGHRAGGGGMIRQFAARAEDRDITAQRQLDDHPLSVGEMTIIISGLSYVRPLGSPTKTAVPSLLVPEAEA